MEPWPSGSVGWSVIFFFFFLIYFIDFLQRGRERDRELETSMREKHRSAASCTSPTGDVPATQVHALDRNRTWDPSVHRLTLHPQSQTGFGWSVILYAKRLQVGFWSRHTPRLQVQSPVEVCMGAINGCFPLTLMFLSLSLPSSP
uniref:Uncharacterized protein n=1 Tax=Myotis myotis TaxID=51298 RepID=A0A7J7WHS6_MYOMY|nr:hypothetical protein mMyoMyo1_012153 [Myotis myotis]